MRAEVLVTGGGGLLGSALHKICPEAVCLTRQDGDLTDLQEVKRLFEEFRPKRVLHLAAEVGGVKKNAAKNADLFEANVLINTHVLRVAREQRVTRLISILSSCAFQFYPDRASDEEDLHVGVPFSGNLGYGYAKRMLDVQTKLLWEQYGYKFSTITPLTMYGPNDNWDLEEGHVVGSLIHRCFLAKQENKPLEVWGDGSAVRQFVYSLDVARILLRELDSFHGPETLIVTPNEGVTIRDLARMIARAMRFDGPVVFNPDKPTGQLDRVVRSKHFSRRFPDFTFTSLEQGLQEAAEWFAHHYQELSVGTHNF